MFIDQGLKRYVGQNIPAIGYEWFAAESAFHVFYATTGFEQHGLVHEGELGFAVTVSGESVRENVRQPVGIDDKRTDSDLNQVIEGECDQRFLKNWNEWFWQLVSQRPQPRAQTGAQHECLSDRSHHANNCPMAETTVWRGTSSQWRNFGGYFLSTLSFIVVMAIFVIARRAAADSVRNFSAYILILLLVPIFMALWRYLQTKNKVYELTTERIKTSEGVFSRVTDTLELYRVKDLEVRQPFLCRIVGIENIQINTSDVSSPFILIPGIPAAAGLADKVRNQVEAIRTQKGVREIDVE